MRFDQVAFVAFLAVVGVAGGPMAQEAAAPVQLCDPLMVMSVADEDEGNPEELTSTTYRYDLESAVPLASAPEIIAAVFEEMWDPATGEAVARAEICPGEPAYLVNWAQVMGTNDAGQPAPLAAGYLSLRKDGSFGFTYEKRPYNGTWTLAGDRVTLTAAWLNGGAPLDSAVEAVKTPVEYRTGAEVVTIDDETYRIGPFRLLPLETTVKGMEQSCSCPVN